MPKYTLSDNLGAWAQTPTHLWYSTGRILHRIHVETLVVDIVHVFSSKIMRIECNDPHCVVLTKAGRLHIAPWQPFAEKVNEFILTPNRVIFRTTGRRIMSYDIGTCATSFIGTGYFGMASGRRAVFIDDGLAISIGAPPAPCWFFVRRRGGQWLECRSRTATRIKRLVKDPALAARVCKFL